MGGGKVMGEVEGKVEWVEGKLYESGQKENKDNC